VIHQINKFLLKLLVVLKEMRNKLFFNFFKKDRQQSFQNNINLDKKLVYSLSKARLPNFRQLRHVGKYLNSKEVLLIRVSVLVIIISLLVIGARFYYVHLQIVPVQGGKYVEGLIGSPYNINPLYASVNDVDSDLSYLIYSSLFKREKNGDLVHDLIRDYSISEDNRIYSMYLKEGIKWHDGLLLKADDVIFTFNLINDKQYKSPLRLSFQGVQIEKQDDYSFKFILQEPYAAFLDLLTFGILPASIWSAYSPESIQLSELNLKPIGSGPYKFKELVKEKKTGHVSEYRLEINQEYYGLEPYVDIVFKFYPDFENAILALNNGLVDGLAYLPENYKEDIMTPKTFNFHELLLPQITVAFFNQEENPALGDKVLRQALSYALDKNALVNGVLKGEAYIIDGPILPSSFAYDPEIKKYDYNKIKAEELLESIDWKLEEINTETIEKAQTDLESLDTESKDREQAELILFLGEGKWRKKDDNYLIINVFTVDRSENIKVVEEIKKYWEDLGIKTIIHSVLASQIQQEIIQARKFDVLFYGQVLGSDPDPYAFWHSSQATENGFNIANFKNKEVDQLLEDARLITDPEKRKEKYKEFQKIISEEDPAIFLYSPLYIYPQSKKIKNFNSQLIFSPSDRFNNVSEWYLEIGKKLLW
jgi:peptide/nickel transport system substrate-binding protein